MAALVSFFFSQVSVTATTSSFLDVTNSVKGARNMRDQMSLTRQYRGDQNLIHKAATTVKNSTGVTYSVD